MENDSEPFEEVWMTIAAVWPTPRTKRAMVALAAAATFGAGYLVPATNADAGPVTCAGERATIVGTAGNNEIDGTPARDIVQARGGNDEVDGLGGNDLICGGPGSDDLAGDAGRDTIFGGRGNDALDGNLGNDRLFGGPGFDDIDGGPGDDTCSGEHVEEC